jgi:hypothetical protein
VKYRKRALVQFLDLVDLVELNIVDLITTMAPQMFDIEQILKPEEPRKLLLPKDKIPITPCTNHDSKTYWKIATKTIKKTKNY